MDYKSITDVLKHPPKTISDCNKAQIMLKKIKTPAAAHVMEMVLMLRKGYEKMES